MCMTIVKLKLKHAFFLFSVLSVLCKLQTTGVGGLKARPHWPQPCAPVGSEIKPWPI